MDFKTELEQQKRQLLIDANAGISFPVAGSIYWLALAILGYYLEPNFWIFIAFCGSGLIFPLGLLLDKPLKANSMMKTELTKLTFPALMGMLTFWPSAIIAYGSIPDLVPLILAIGMGAHWPVICWMYGLNTGMYHAGFRTVFVFLAWNFLPDLRYTLIPLIVMVVYLGSAIHMRSQVKAAIKQQA